MGCCRAAGVDFRKYNHPRWQVYPKKTAIQKLDGCFFSLSSNDQEVNLDIFL